MKNYYSVLGVDRKSTLDEIKAAYRKLAKQYHPDRNPGDKEAESKFKEIQEAYDVIGDVKKKSVYDDPFSPPPKAGTNILSKVEIALEDVIADHTKEIVYEQECICGNCDGKGGQFQKCDYCNGAGYYINPNFNNLHIATTCASCKGIGASVTNICTECRGSGYSGVQEKREIIKIPKGIKTGEKLSFRNEGNPGRNKGRAGYLIVEIAIKEHEFFAPLDNGDVLCKVPITIHQAALGDEIDVPTLHNKIITLKVPIGVQSGTKLKINKLGIPIGTHSSTLGNMLVELRVETPVNLSDKFIEELERTNKFNDDAFYPNQAKFKKYIRGIK
jgi:molecular chaperone DnaJ